MIFDIFKTLLQIFDIRTQSSKFINDCTSVVKAFWMNFLENEYCPQII